ncbi:MAG TPA: hypothetical protein VHT97_15495 [Acidimicrobiales bacterium]|jgi:hypothetical protein|nr:hypothetical protein [Acidimicrobiales bacterium]
MTAAALGWFSSRARRGGGVQTDRVSSGGVSSRAGLAAAVLGRGDSLGTVSAALAAVRGRGVVVLVVADASAAVRFAVARGLAPFAGVLVPDATVAARFAVACGLAPSADVVLFAEVTAGGAAVPALRVALVVLEVVDAFAADALAGPEVRVPLVEVRGEEAADFAAVARFVAAGSAGRPAADRVVRPSPISTPPADGGSAAG